MHQNQYFQNKKQNLAKNRDNSIKQIRQITINQKQIIQILKIQSNFQQKIFKATKKILVQCSPYCKTCDANNLSICLTCKDTFKKNGEFCECQVGSYIDVQGNCKKCDSTCQDCSDFDSCDTCKDPKLQKQLGKCVKSCDINQFFQDGEAQQNNICLKCSEEISFCNKCEYNKSTDSVICVSCSDGTELKDGECIPQCQEQYYQDQASKECKKCSEQIGDCNLCDFKQGVLQCNLCNDQKILFNGQCISPCTQSDEYPNKNNNNQCEKCSKIIGNCDICEIDQQKLTCKTCSNQKQFKDEKCQDQCEPGKFRKDNECQKCDLEIHDCINCNYEDQTLVCQKCKYPKVFYDNQCKVCEANYKIDQTQTECIHCSKYIDKNCQECDQNDKCTKCYGNKEIKNGICTPNCEKGYYHEKQTDTCIVCDDKCLQCSSKTECQKCDHLSYLHKGICKDKCPSEFQADQNRVCQKKEKPSKNKVKVHSQQNNVLLIEFQNETQNIQDLTKGLVISIPFLGEKIEYTTDIIDNKTLKITIHSDKSSNKEEDVTISLPNLDGEQFTLEKNNTSVKLHKEKKVDPESKKAMESLEAATKATSTAAVSAIVPLTMSGNFWIIASILDISQLIYLSTFINIEFAGNLDAFLSSQKNFQIPFRNFFESLKNYKSITYSTYPKIEENEIQGFLLSNLGDSLSLIITIFCVNGFLHALQMAFIRIKTISSKINYVKSKIFSPQFYFDLLWSVYQDICFACIIQTFSFEKPSFVEEYLNYIFYTIGIFTTLLPFFIYILMKKEKYPVLNEYFSEHLNFKYYRLALYFRKFFYSLVVVPFQFSANTQLIMIIIYHVSFFIFQYKYKPYQLPFDNFKECSQTFLFILSYGVILFLSYYDSSDNQFNVLISWIVVGSLGGILFFELLICIKEIYVQVKGLILKIKNRKQLAKVQPANLENAKGDQESNNNLSEKQFNNKFAKRESQGILINNSSQIKSNNYMSVNNLESALSPNKFEDASQNEFFNPSSMAINGEKSNIYFDTPFIAKKRKRQRQKVSQLQTSIIVSSSDKQLDSPIIGVEITSRDSNNNIILTRSTLQSNRSNFSKQKITSNLSINDQIL